MSSPAGVTIAEGGGSEVGTSTPAWREGLLLSATVLLATWLVFFRLDRESFWLDELYSLLTSTDHDGLRHLLTSAEPNMLLYQVMLRYWLRLGDSEFLVRALSAVFFIATVPLVWAVGRCLFGRRVALCAALLFATNGYMLRYAQEARAYSLAIALVTASTWCFLWALARPSFLRWVAYGLCSLLALYAHLFAALVVAAQFASLLGRRPRDLPWPGLVGTAATLLIGAIPLAVIPGDFTRPDWLIAPRLADLGDLYLTFAGGRWELAVVLAVLALAAIEVWRGADARVRRGAWLVASWAILPTVTAFAVSIAVLPVFQPHYLLVTMPAFVLALGVGLGSIRRHWAFAVALALLMAASARTFHVYHQRQKRDDFRGAASYVSAHARPGDAVTFFSYAIRAPFQWYLEREGRAPATLCLVELAGGPYPRGDGSSLPEPDHQALAGLAQRYDRLFLVVSHANPNPALRRDRQLREITDAIEASYSLTGEVRLVGVQVRTYQRLGGGRGPPPSEGPER